jgi:hypothetical protein
VDVARIGSIRRSSEPMGAAVVAERPSGAPGARTIGRMISTEAALALREAGLVWRPRSGDRFQLDEPEFDADVFTVSEMTIEARDYPTGTILAFNGTTEWALDSVALADALWLPTEEQLREMLRGGFRALRRLADTYEVEVAVGDEVRRLQHPEPSDAYAQAVLALLARIA